MPVWAVDYGLTAPPLRVGPRAVRQAGKELGHLRIDHLDSVIACHADPVVPVQNFEAAASSVAHSIISPIKRVRHRLLEGHRSTLCSCLLEGLLA